MAKKKEDPAKVEQRKQERVAFVQGHPLLQPEQARQQFYVQTRAQELEARGLPVNRAQLRDNFQTGNIQREGFYTPGDISRVAAQQQNNNTSNDSNTPTPTPDAPAGPVYAGGQPTTRTTPSNDYVAPERTTALGGKIPAAAQFRMDSAGASGFGKTGESRLVPDVAPPTAGITWTPNNASAVPDSVIGVPGKTYQTSGTGDKSLTAYSKQAEKNRKEFKNVTGPLAEGLVTTVGSVLGGALGGLQGSALGSGLANYGFNMLDPYDTSDSSGQAAKRAAIVGATDLVAGAVIGKVAPLVKPAIGSVVGKIKKFNSVAKIETKMSKEILSEVIPGELRRAPFYDATNKAPSSVASPFPTPIKPITGTPWKPVAPTEVVPSAPWRPTETVLDSGLVIPPSGTRTKAAVQGIDAPVISGQSLADSKPVSSMETVLKEDNVKELTPRQVAARAREAKKKLAREALTETTPVAQSRTTFSQVEADIEATRLADIAAGINNPPDPTIDDFLRSSKPQSALSQEPIGAAASDPNLASPTALNPSGKVTVADAINQGQAKAALKPPSEDTVKYLAEQDRLAALNKLTPAERLETFGTEPSVKNPNRNKALIRPAGDPLPGMEQTGNRFDKAEQAVLNKTGFFDTEIPAPKPRSVFEAKTDVDEAFSRITPDELGRAQLENKSLGEIVLPKLEAVRAENKAMFRDRVREYEDRRYPNMSDMSGRPIPTPDANKPVTISLDDAIKQGQAKAPVADSVDQGLVEAKRLFEETGVAPKRGSDYLLNKKTGEIYKVNKQANKQPGVKLTPEQKAANRKITRQKENANKRVSRAITSGKIDVATAKEVLANKPGTVSLADAIKQGTAKEVSEPELGPFLINGDLYTYKTFPKTKAGPLGATGRQTDRAKAALTEPIYPRGLPDNAPFDTPPNRISPAQEKAYTTTLANQAKIFETTGTPTLLETQTREQVRKLFGVEALNRIDAAAGTGINTTIKLPTAVTEPTISVVKKPKFMPSGKIKGSTRSEQIANWTKYSNSEGFKTLSLTNPQKYAEIVEANRAIDAAMKTDIQEALGKQSAFKLQMPSQSGKSISASDDPWQKSLTAEGGPMPTEFAGGTKNIRSTDPVLLTDRVQNLPYGAEISPADPSKYVPKMPNPIPENASKEQQMAFNSAVDDYFKEMNGVGDEALGRAQAAMNLENQTALREQAAAMPNSPLKRETIKELNTFNRTNYPNENYPGFGTSGRNSTMNADDYLNLRTSPWQSSTPRERVIDPGDTFEKFSKSRLGKGKTEADYAVAKAEYDSKLAALEAEPRGFTGDVEPFVGRFSPEQNQSLEAWSASRQVTETTPRTTVSIDELTAGSTNEARVAMEEDAFERAEAIAAQVKFKAEQVAERTDYFNTRTERGDFDLMREGFARQDANKAAISKPPTREEVLKTGVIRRLKTRIAEKEAADAAAAQAAARADAEEALPLNVDQYYRERWDQSNPWVVQARQGYQTRIDQSGLTNLETRYTSNRPRGLYRGGQPGPITEQSVVVPRSEVSNAAPVSPGVQLRQNAANRDEWLAANEKLKGTPDYIYERSIDEVAPPDMTEAVTSIKDEAAANAAEATKEYEGFDYTAFE